MSCASATVRSTSAELRHDHAAATGCVTAGTRPRSTPEFPRCKLERTTDMSYSSGVSRHTEFRRAPDARWFLTSVRGPTIRSAASSTTASSRILCAGVRLPRRQLADLAVGAADTLSGELPSRSYSRSAASARSRACASASSAAAAIGRLARASVAARRALAAFGQALYAGVRAQVGEMRKRFDGLEPDVLYGLSGSVGGRTRFGPFLFSLGYVDGGERQLQFMLGRSIAEGSLFRRGRSRADSELEDVSSAAILLIHKTPATRQQRPKMKRRKLYSGGNSCRWARPCRSLRRNRPCEFAATARGRSRRAHDARRCAGSRRPLLGLSFVEPLVRDALAARQREEAFLSRSGRAGELRPRAAGDLRRRRQGRFRRRLAQRLDGRPARGRASKPSRASAWRVDCAVCVPGPEHDRRSRRSTPRSRRRTSFARGASSRRSRMTAWPTSAALALISKNVDERAARGSRRRAREGQNTPNRHDLSRRSPTRRLEHRQHRLERRKRRARSLQVDPLALIRDPGRPADADRRGGRRQDRSRNARRRGRFRASVPRPVVDDANRGARSVRGWCAVGASW